MDNAPPESADPPTEPSLIGRSIGKYQMVRLVGRGGMGAVYEALNTTIQKRVAMKCIDPTLAGNDEANARFQREALAASSIESPHIVQIFDAGATDEGVPYIVMELLRGRDLGKCIGEVGQLELTDALHIVAQVLKGLHHAHSAGIIHRDLKPDNVFLVERDDEPYDVKLLDFGVSKISRSAEVPLKTLTQQGTVVGTPVYMSPEQAQAFPDVDSRTDIYSVGAILYECLTGLPPHSGLSYEQVIVNICVKDAPDVRGLNSSVPESVARVVKRALCRERDDRYGSARELLDALMECAPDELRDRYHSSASGMRKLSIRSGARTMQQVRGDAAPAPAAPPAARSAAAHGALADTVQADSGMMSVAAPPSEPTLPPLQSPRRRWALALGALAAVAVLVGALVLPSLGESESGSAAPGESAVPLVGTSADPAGSAAGGAAGGDEEPPAPASELDAGPSEAAASATPTTAVRRPPRTPEPPRTAAATPKATAAPLPMATGAPEPPSGLPLMTE